MSLGGMRDESEIRGHRKTYIGAMPGRIIQSIRKAKSANPVFVLDEIDKLLGMNVQGDPSAAMLEVLDPEQNTAFYDNYLETTFDLSHILFIATANSLNTVHPALIDRMEVIELSSYLLEEKVNIAKRHLIPRQIGEHGLKTENIGFTDQIIQNIVTDYTREAGVRVLEKQIAKMIRHRAFQIVSENNFSTSIRKEDLADVLGVPLFRKESELKDNTIGVAIGLAWTPVGGEILFVETAVSEGKGSLVLTGNLGDVMKESATIAYEYLKIHDEEFDLECKNIRNKDVFIHVPEGATPKDGPSAGITLLTALLSTFTKKHIRPNIAMTGEITLRGKITPVGGIKEKILAAKRVGITTIVLPEANRKDVEDIEQEYVSGIEFHYFENMTDALRFNFGG
jgi:ATP-dependent Lon protease